MPKQGEKAPWYLRQNYLLDLFTTWFGRNHRPVARHSRAGADRRSVGAAGHLAVARAYGAERSRPGRHSEGAVTVDVQERQGLLHERARRW